MLLREARKNKRCLCPGSCSMACWLLGSVVGTRLHDTPLMPLRCSEREECHGVPLMGMWLHDRQKEKREDIKEVLRARGYESVWDMSSLEQERQYFEGTGVLVLDRVNGVAYVNISERAHPDLAQRWADHLGYKVGASPECAWPNGSYASTTCWPQPNRFCQQERHNGIQQARRYSKCQCLSHAIHLRGLCCWKVYMWCRRWSHSGPLIQLALMCTTQTS